MTAKPVDVRAARARFTAWVDAWIEDHAEVELSAMTAAALAAFGTDWEVWRGFLPDLVYREAQDRLSRRRKQAVEAVRNARIVQVVDRATDRVPATKLTRYEERIATFLDTYYEHVGNRHIQLGNMTRDDLLQAAAERTARGSVELARAAVFRRLASPMRPGETVRERWSPDALMEVWALSEAGAPALPAVKEEA